MIFVFINLPLRSVSFNCNRFLSMDLQSSKKQAQNCPQFLDMLENWWVQCFIPLQCKAIGPITYCPYHLRLEKQNRNSNNKSISYCTNLSCPGLTAQPWSIDKYFICFFLYFKKSKIFEADLLSTLLKKKKSQSIEMLLLDSQNALSQLSYLASCSLLICALSVVNYKPRRSSSPEIVLYVDN